MNFETYPGLLDAFQRSGISEDQKYNPTKIEQHYVDVLPPNGFVYEVVGSHNGFWFLMDDSIIMAKKLFKMNTERVPLKLITGIQVSRSLGQGWVLLVSRANNTDEFPLFKKQETLTRFANAVNERISSLNETKSGSSESSLDKIKKLKELLDMGVISQSEFDEKKSKLLKDI